MGLTSLAASDTDGAAQGITSLAASDTAGTVQEILDALNKESADEEITITLTADIVEALAFAAQEGKTIIINGGEYGMSDVQINGTGNVILNTNIEGTGNHIAALIVEGIDQETSSGLSVTVTGDISGKNGQGQSGASVSNATLKVTGNIIGGNRGNQNNISDGAGLAVVFGGQAEVGGTAQGGSYAEGASHVSGGDGVRVDGEGSKAVVGEDAIGGDSIGDVTQGGTGAAALNGAQAEVGRDAVGGSGNLKEEEWNKEDAYSDGGEGVYAEKEGSIVSVGGSAVGGDAQGTLADAGEGVNVWDGGNVSVEGNATGGSGAGGDLAAGRANGGSGVFASGEDTSVRGGGSSTGGNSTGASGGSGGDGATVQSRAQVRIGKDLTGGSREGTADTDGNGGDGATVDGSGSSLTVGGNVTGGDLNGSTGEAGEGLDVEGAASVNVDGNVTGGNSKEAAGSTYQAEDQKAGDAISVEYESIVAVKGDVTGGKAEGTGEGGNAVLVLTLLPAEAEMLTAGTVDIDGTAMGGTGNTPGTGIYYSLSYMLTYDVDETTDSFQKEEVTLDPDMFIMRITVVAEQMASSGLLSDKEAAEFSYYEITATLHSVMSGLAIPDNIQDDDVFQKYLEDCQAEVERLVSAGADEDTLIEKAWAEAAKIDAKFDAIYTARMASVNPAEYTAANTLLIAALSNGNGGAYVTSDAGSVVGEKTLASNSDNKVTKVNVEGTGNPKKGDIAQYAMWFVLCAAAVSAVVLTVAKRKKSN